MNTLHFALLTSYFALSSTNDTSFGDLPIHNVCWRADDRAVFLVTERGGVHQDLWEVPVEGGDATARQLAFAQADEGSPSVSADGKWMLYTDNRFGPAIRRDSLR